MGAAILFAQLSNKTENSWLAIKLTITLKQLALDRKRQNHYRSKDRNSLILAFCNADDAAKEWLRYSIYTRLKV